MTFPISAALIGVVMVLALCISCTVIDELARRWRNK
jgi:hypothetical protein